MGLEFFGVTFMWKRGTLKLPKELENVVELNPGDLVLIFVDRERKAITLKPVKSVKFSETGEVVLE